ncbi:MAG: hypothetical protein VKJ04_01815 [Vampirovibrionales bacterium]|nr:hypothetical protein [Vampirovibrionales bacterium]
MAINRTQILAPITQALSNLSLMPQAPQAGLPTGTGNIQPMQPVNLDGQGTDQFAAGGGQESPTGPGKSGKTPPGLAKKGGVPPGLAKKDPNSLPDGNPWKQILLYNQQQQAEQQQQQQAPPQEMASQQAPVLMA